MTFYRMRGKIGSEPTHVGCYRSGWGMLACALLLCIASAAGEGVNQPVVYTQVPVEAAVSKFAQNAGARVDWFDAARVVVRTPDGRTKVLSAGFASACDPDVSFDGKHVVFAGKRERTDPWSLWEADLRGGEPRCVRREARDCRNPIYLGSLFTLDSPEPWNTLLFIGTEPGLDEQGTGSATSLYSIKLDGSESRRLTFNPSRCFDPIQTWDGRVLYATWHRALEAAPAAGRVSLFGVHIDGMEHELYAAGQGKRIQHMPCATEGGLVVVVETDAARPDGAGQLACVKEQLPHHSYRPLTHDARVVWIYPSPLTGNTLLVSRREIPSGSSGIYRYDADTGRAEVVIDDPQYHEVQAKVIRARRPPDGRSTVVDTKYSTGKLYGLNCYTADPKLQPHIAPGTIQRIRVLEGVSTRQASSASDTAALVHRLLGEAPVEPDGSFHLEIPADVPVRLQTLDSNGLALATCDWIWVKQKENRGCIGCHEDPELIPENFFVSALGRPANRLTLPPEKRRAVTFRENVVPILRDRCALADCHGGTETPLPLPLSSGSAKEARAVYQALLAQDDSRHRKYVQPGSARASFLAWQIFGKDISQSPDRSAEPANARKVKQMPPPGKAAPLRAEERRIITEWIDLGAPWEMPKQSAGDQTAAVKP